jgi:cyclic pyranopterin phosphate synthase
MVDVSEKPDARRLARARARIVLPKETVQALANLDVKKGSPLHVAVLGGIMGAKQTSNLIPLCHQVPLDDVQVEVKQNLNVIQVECIVKAFYHTGVEMEAMMGASIASLVVYDMLKATSLNICIESIRLMEKRGGKRDFCLSE